MDEFYDKGPQDMSLAGFTEATDSKDLMHLPLVQVEGTKAAFRIGIAGSNFFSFAPGLRPDNINTDLSIRRRPGHDDLSCLVLPLHPSEMLVQRYGPFLSWSN